MVAAFSFDRVSLGGPVFDLVKLSAMNADYLRALPDEEIVRRLRDWRLSDDRLRALVPLVRERMQRLDEFVPLTDFFFSGDLDYGPVAKDLLPKERTPKEVADLLALFSEALDAQRDFTPAGLEASARAFAEKNSWSSKELFMLLRLAATAKKATPPLFETLAGLGRELVRRRIRLCADLVKKMPAAPPKPAATAAKSA
jgi:glutamyl-tRNA synthetase